MIDDFLYREQLINLWREDCPPEHIARILNIPVHVIKHKIFELENNWRLHYEYVK